MDKTNLTRAEIDNLIAGFEREAEQCEDESERAELLYIVSALRMKRDAVVEEGFVYRFSDGGFANLHGDSGRLGESALYPLRDTADVPVRRFTYTELMEEEK